MATQRIDVRGWRRNAANALLDLLNDPDRPAFEEAVIVAARRLPTSFQNFRDAEGRPTGFDRSPEPPTV